MTTEAIDRGQPERHSEPVNITDLNLGHALALLVDTLNLGPTTVGVTLRKRPTSDDKTAGDILVTGTPEQVNVFKHALGTYQEAVAGRMSPRAIQSVMHNFVMMQELRHGRGIS